MSHILFIDANVPAIDAMRRAKSHGHTVSLIRSTSFQFYPKTGETYRVFESLDRDLQVASTTDVDLLTECVRGVLDEESIDAVIAQSEFAVEAASDVTDRLGLRFTSTEAVRNARDKGRARDLLRRAGLATPAHRVVDDIAELPDAVAEVGLPVVVKPLSGADSMLAYRADDLAGAVAAGKRIEAAAGELPDMIREQFSRGILVERHLQGRLVSAEVGALNGRFYRFMVSGRPRSRYNECIELGSFMPADLSESQRVECFAYAERVCAALGLDLGIFHIEMIFTDDGPVLVEANPRLMGGIMPELYQLLTGRNIHDYEISIYLGEPVTEAIPPAGPELVTSRKIMPRFAGTLAPTLDWSWWKAQEHRVSALHLYRLEPGLAVAADEVLARYVIRSEDRDAATALAGELLDGFEDMLGIPLHH